jgi:hypothetical protein
MTTPNDHATIPRLDLRGLLVDGEPVVGVSVVLEDGSGASVALDMAELLEAINGMIALHHTYARTGGDMAALLIAGWDIFIPPDEPYAD